MSEFVELIGTLEVVEVGGIRPGQEAQAMRNLAVLVGLPHEVEEALEVREQFFCRIKELELEIGKVFEGTVLDRLRSLNNARAWVDACWKLQYISLEQGGKSDMVSEAVAQLLKSRNRNPEVWSPEGRARREAEAEARREANFKEKYEAAAQAAKSFGFPGIEGAVRQIMWAEILREKMRILAVELGEDKKFNQVVHHLMAQNAQFWIGFKKPEDFISLLGWTLISEKELPAEGPSLEGVRLSDVSGAWRKMAPDELEWDRIRLLMDSKTRHRHNPGNSY